MSPSAKPRRVALAALSPPTSSKDTSGRSLTSTRPLRSPYFSPTLAKTSSSRRWIAHSCSNGWTISSPRPRRGTRPTPRALGNPRLRPAAWPRPLDALAGARLDRAAARLVEHAVLDEHRHLGPDRERDRVRGARVEGHLAPGRAQGHERVVNVVPHVGDDHALERHVQAVEERHDEVVRERPRRLHPLEGHGDAVGLGEADRHRQAPLVPPSLHDHDRLLRARIEHHGHDVDLLGSGDRGRRGIAALAGTDGALKEQDTHGQEADPAQRAHDDATSFLTYCRASSRLTLKANPMSRISESAVHMSPYPSRAPRYPKTKATSAFPLSTAALKSPTTAPRRRAVVASVTSAASPG